MSHEGGFRLMRSFIINMNKENKTMNASTLDLETYDFDELMEEINKQYIFYPCTECGITILLPKEWTKELRAKKVCEHFLDHWKNKRPSFNITPPKIY